jgi:hypothetical protein
VFGCGIIRCADAMSSQHYRQRSSTTVEHTVWCKVTEVNKIVCSHGSNHDAVVWIGVMAVSAKVRSDIRGVSTPAALDLMRGSDQLSLMLCSS